MDSWEAHPSSLDQVTAQVALPAALHTYWLAQATGLLLRELASNFAKEKSMLGWLSHYQSRNLKHGV